MLAQSIARGYFGWDSCFGEVWNEEVVEWTSKTPSSCESLGSHTWMSDWVNEWICRRQSFTPGLSPAGPRHGVLHNSVFYLKNTEVKLSGEQILFPLFSRWGNRLIEVKIICLKSEVGCTPAPALTFPCQVNFCFKSSDSTPQPPHLLSSFETSRGSWKKS